MELWTAAITDKGIKKEKNQDALLIKVAQSPIGKVGMAVICDGMGGLSRGELASATLINAIDEWFVSKAHLVIAGINREHAIYESLKQVVETVDQKIKVYGNRERIQLGTTLCLLLIIDADYYIFYVGDTRTYINNGNLIQVTKDHTLVQQEIDCGRMTEAEAEMSPNRSVLLQCVGAGMVLEPGYLKGTITGNDIFLMCSDGFRHVLSHEEIQRETQPTRFCSEQMMQESLCYMVETIKARNEEDNISAVMIKVCW